MTYTVIKEGKAFRVAAMKGAPGVEQVTELPSFPVRCDRCGWMTVQLREVGGRVQMCSCGGSLREAVA